MKLRKVEEDPESRPAPVSAPSVRVLRSLCTHVACISSCTQSAGIAFNTSLADRVAAMLDKRREALADSDDEDEQDFEDDW
jgi:hypothetical protein